MLFQVIIFDIFLITLNLVGVFQGLVASTGVVAVPATVYSWVVITVLPINAIIDPLLYTLSTKLQEKVGFIRFG